MSATVNSIECDPELITDPATSALIETTPSYFDDCVALKEKLALLVQQYDWSRFEELYTGDELDYLKEHYLEHNSLEWVTMHLGNMSAFDDEAKRVISARRISLKYKSEIESEPYHGRNGFFRNGNAFQFAIKSSLVEGLAIPFKDNQLSTCDSSGFLHLASVQGRMVADFKLKNSLHKILSPYLRGINFRINDVFQYANTNFVFVHTEGDSISLERFAALSFVSKIDEAYRFVMPQLGGRHINQYCFYKKPDYVDFDPVWEKQEAYEYFNSFYDDPLVKYVDLTVESELVGWSALRLEIERAGIYAISGISDYKGNAVNMIRVSKRDLGIIYRMDTIDKITPFAFPN